MKRHVTLLLVYFLAQHSTAESMYKQDPMWSYSFNGRVYSMLALNESVLVGVDDGLHCLEYTRTPKWTIQTTGAVTSIHKSSDIVYASSDGILGAVDIHGSRIWEREIPGYVGYSKALDARRDLVLAGSMDGFVYLFDDKGIFKWKRLIGSYVTNAKILEDRIIAVSDRQAYIIDLDGTVRRNLNISGFIRSSSILEDLAVIALDDGMIYAYEPGGRIKWTYDAQDHVGVLSSHDAVAAGTRRGKLLYFNPAGELLWERNFSSSVISCELGGDYVLASVLREQEAGNLVSLYNIKGDLRWFYETSARTPVLSIMGRNILSATTSGRIYYSKLPKRDVVASFMLSIAIIVLVGAAIMVVSKSWR